MIMCEGYVRSLLKVRDVHTERGIKSMSNTSIPESTKFTEAESSVSKRVVELARELDSEIRLTLMPSRETSLVITKLEEAIMWANRSISVNGVRGE